MPVPGTHDPDRQHVQHRVVAFEVRCIGVFDPVGPEGDLRRFAVIGPFSGNAFGPMFGRMMPDALEKLKEQAK